MLASILACGLLLLWLLATLRPARNVFVCVVALGIGFLAAILAVQFIFGGVHVIALGFGGALMGMAMDYPIHLLTHRGRSGDSARARRYIGLCVATTGIAFLALIGSGVPALAQVGVLVACGLFVAAVASVILTSNTRIEARTFTLHGGRPIAVSWKLPALCLIALASAVVVSQVQNRLPEKLIEPPPEVIRSIERMGNLIDLPSGRFRVDVTGRTLGAVLDRQAQLATVLEAAVRDGSLLRASMLAAYLPQRPAPFDLPQPDFLAARLSEALAEAGLAPNFATKILEAYTASRNLAPPGSAALGSLMRLPELAGLMSVEGGVLRASVRLWGLSDPEHLAGAVREIGDTGIVFVDQQSAIGSGLQKLTATAATWMAIGAGAGILLLFLALRPMTVAVEIVLACLAAGLATAAAASILTGGLGLFQIVALALVVGIGIDYGLFLTLSESGEEFAAATSSVLVCAGSTLIAFLTMALSEVNVLEDIGATLSIGVIVMLAVHFPRRSIAGRPRE
jgi:predicted exporter